ncbi:Predicted DNA-binding transcriptional regulator YafY, contains an HTH and WYL domains [Allochromatium warmingii]|uniref:Predicted DNA-binding transcriptional regulator YafY, contains an HTH and WYL domains n=1 Tax=Allochromatium warmingii TaxID=61595 RepID=A0A1H3BVX5_ALLWA|nr:WYL domain-containing protein [Allochromatium warmingii]SDX45986.1 Predicted DNA-binding transcriptional regulator YafY, contains an HTH and WYL domains [Allochromatium warmingii]
MSAAHFSRIERLKQLEACLPVEGRPERCPDVGRLLDRLGDLYGSASEAATRRALQRDLQELVQTGRITIVNPNGKPLRYRRLIDDPDDDPAVWNWMWQQVLDQAGATLPRRQLDRVWQHLLTSADGPRLDESRLRILPDTLRLQPVELYAGVLRAVIQALIQRRALRVRYRKPSGERCTSDLHPQALIQRGPIPYLFALKNAETAPVRLYALHRMTHAELLPETPARPAEGFDLDTAIADGRADFGSGETINLELRVRGYLADVLRVCPLAAEQRLEDEPHDSAFQLHIWAQVPSTGQLLRWLLGAGANLEVLAPPDLRRTIAAQTYKTAALYAGTSACAI